MTFKGSCKTDLEQILTAFPRQFTAKELENYFEWPVGRVRQAIIYGQQTDLVRLIVEPKSMGNNDNRTVDLAIYENVRWRREWMTRAWGSHGAVVSQG